MPGLKENIAAYEQLRGDLETDHFGKWVVFHDSQFVGSYGSFDDAAEEAIRRFGRGPYLIRQVGVTRVALPASVMYRPIHAHG